MKSINQIIVGLESVAEHAEVMSKTPGWSAMAGTYREEASLLREAIAKLRTHPDAQPNEPLTLEELRLMGGLPAWVESPGVDREISGRWVIVDGVNRDKKTLFTRGDFTCHDYGTVWLAYRRPPKEEK